MTMPNLLRSVVGRSIAMGSRRNFCSSNESKEALEQRYLSLRNWASFAAGYFIIAPCVYGNDTVAAVEESRQQVYGGSAASRDIREDMWSDISPKHIVKLLSNLSGKDKW